MKHKFQATLLALITIFLCQGVFAQNPSSTVQQDNNQPERLAARISDDQSRRMMEFDVTKIKSPLLSFTDSGPAPTVFMRLPEQWLAADRRPQTSDGKHVSAFKFRAWREGATIRVAVYAVINDSQSGADVSKEVPLQEKLIEIYNCNLGETKEFSVMKEFGAKPLRLSVMKSADLFKTR